MGNARSQPGFRSKAANRSLGHSLYRGVYADAPYPFLLLTPELEIIGANEAYLTATMRRADELVGRDMFDAFPDNPLVSDANGVRNLRGSLVKVRSAPQRDVMAIQRYDVIDRTGVWNLRYWRPINWAVRDDRGSVIALVHHVMDATGDILEDWLASVSSLATSDLVRRAEAASETSRTLREQVRRGLIIAKSRSRKK
jgi:hypothetical protein